MTNQVDELICPLCGKSYPGTYYLEPHEDFILIKDEGNVIRHNCKSEKFYARMKSQQTQVRQRSLSESVRAVLEELGYEDPKQAPETLTLLAERAASGRSGDVTALRELMKSARSAGGLAGWDDREAFERGQKPCQMCGSWRYPDIEIQKGVLFQVFELLYQEKWDPALTEALRLIREMQTAIVLYGQGIQELEKYKGAPGAMWKRRAEGDNNR